MIGERGGWLRQTSDDREGKEESQGFAVGGFGCTMPRTSCVQGSSLQNETSGVNFGGGLAVGKKGKWSRLMAIGFTALKRVIAVEVVDRCG